jgi:sigma-B regulation protein RsbU (phosphoserine phosphatase)
MPLVLRPRQQNNTSDPLYAAGKAPTVNALSHVPVWLRILWMAVVACFLLVYVPRVGGWFSLIRWGALAVALVATGPALYRAAQRGMLWRLRNKLILTYLLIGLTPVILFFTLVFLSTYVAAGQFAVHLAASHLQLQLDSMGTSDAGLAFALARRLESGASIESLSQRQDGGEPPAVPVSVPSAASATSAKSATSTPAEPTPGPRGFGGRQIAVFVDDTPIDQPGNRGNARSPLRLADWIAKRHSGQMKVVAADGGVLYMAVVDRVAAAHDHVVTVIGSVPVTPSLLNGVAEGLGQVTLMPGLELQSKKITSNKAVLRRKMLVGGSNPVASSLLDFNVDFSSKLSVLDWDTGEVQSVLLTVDSRPSILFEQLFGVGLTGRITDSVRALFFAICVFFALLEIFAFYVAVRLTMSMTGSVEDLYAATLAIDSGNLGYRIQVQQDDQLADLGRSFNRMAWSLSRLIESQKEKERMQSELTIAQEVQANLFPRASVRVPSLDLHGICRPARTVSGDYYDFLVFHDNPDDPKEMTGVGLALGDISGKGISAALLMATLHAAVRAYRFINEELFSDTARTLTRSESLECGELFESPGRILSLLNRHLYRTTQPEKYATLFLAHYEDRTGRLTYSNGGQLPPFILRRDGTLLRLDKGGTVVGLIDGTQYDQETIAMEPGDLLIAYSDGVTEPENDFGEFGEDRLVDVVREFRNEPLDIISAEVMRALDAWIGGEEQPDDITLVLARKV